MPAVIRQPRPSLRPFVSAVWALDSGSEPACAGGGLERVLPTGMMHVVLRVSAAPLTIYGDDSGANPRGMGHALIGGARSSFYVRDVSAPSHSIGAVLRPGAASLLFGVPAGELAERHTGLAELCSAAEVARLRERMADASSLEREAELLESWLAARLPEAHGLHPAVAEALARFSSQATVGEVVKSSGLSHRSFVSLFRHSVGLRPKVFCRVMRVQRSAELLTSRARPPLADVALAAGYADQPHFTREFSEVAGVSPARYRALAPSRPNHVPVRP